MKGTGTVVLTSASATVKDSYVSVVKSVKAEYNSSCIDGANLKRMASSIMASLIIATYMMDM